MADDKKRSSRFARWRTRRRGVLCYNWSVAAQGSKGISAMRTFDKTTRTPRISRAMNAWIVAVACACALGTRADTGYLIEMMDISNEAGPRPARTGATHTCGKIHWRSLNVETPSRVTIPLGGAAKSFTAAAGIAMPARASSTTTRSTTSCPISLRR